MNTTTHCLPVSEMSEYLADSHRLFTNRHEHRAAYRFDVARDIAADLTTGAAYIKTGAHSIEAQLHEILRDGTVTGAEMRSLRRLEHVAHGITEAVQ